MNTLNALTCMEYKKSKDWNSETVTLITYVNGDIEDIHNIYIGDEFLENLPIYKVNECNKQLIK